MLIQFYCDNHCADFEKDEFEIIYQKQSFTHCAFCGQKLHIKNLEELIEFDIEMRVRTNIDKWVKEIGWDNVLDLVQRNKEQACYRLYKAELEKRGFKFN